MKAYIVVRRFDDGSAEGVMFTDPADAGVALDGDCIDGSALAHRWCELYGGDPVEMVEVEI